jgi:hypothetical protein
MICRGSMNANAEETECDAKRRRIRLICASAIQRHGQSDPEIHAELLSKRQRGRGEGGRLPSKRTREVTE